MFFPVVAYRRGGKRAPTFFMGVQGAMTQCIKLLSLRNPYVW